MSRQRERDAAEEIECHIEERIAELEEAGIPHEQAAHQARREFGNTTIVTEDNRAVWRCQAWDACCGPQLSPMAAGVRRSEGRHRQDIGHRRQTA